MENNLEEINKDKLNQDIETLITNGLHISFGQRSFTWTVETFKKEFGSVLDLTKTPYFFNKELSQRFYQDILQGIDKFIYGQLNLRQKVLVDGGITKLVWRNNQKVFDPIFLQQMPITPGLKINNSYLDIYVGNTILNKEYLFKDINFFVSFLILD